MAQYINKDAYVGDTGKQLKDIKTNADNISNNTTKINNNTTKINNLKKQLVGTFPLTTSIFGSSTVGTVDVFNNYNFKEQLLSMFPTKSGFTRTYIVGGILNTSQNTITIYLGGYEILDTSIWGSNNNYNGRFQFNDITSIVNKIGTGHCKVTCNNVTGSGGNFYTIHPLTLYVYDELQ